MNSEIERFAKEVGKNPAFLQELKTVGSDHKAVVSFANKKGYKFTLDDVQNEIGRTGETMTESSLDNIVGGAMFIYGGSGGYVMSTYHKAFVWW